MLQSIRHNVAWRAIPVAGLAGGTVFLVTIFLLSSVWLGIDGTVMLHYFASLAVGPDTLLETNTSTLLMGVSVHYILSIVFALIIAIVVHRWGLLVGILGGAVLGASLYAINLYTVTLWFPWFFAINSSLLFLAHVLYGAVTGAVYEMLDTFDEGLGQGTEVSHDAA